MYNSIGNNANQPAICKYGLQCFIAYTYPLLSLSYQELISDIEKTTNVVEATNKPRLYERLETLQNDLALCEKALAEYLETKRLAFPRFYFVSSADLLDILSNGNNPTTVCIVDIDCMASCNVNILKL